MANPKNPGYLLKLGPTNDPDVVLVYEEDDVEGVAPVRGVSAVEAGRLAHVAQTATVPKPKPKPKPAPKPAPTPAPKIASKKKPGR